MTVTIASGHDLKRIRTFITKDGRTIPFEDFKNGNINQAPSGDNTENREGEEGEEKTEGTK